jgi:hypothetical protein
MRKSNTVANVPGRQTSSKVSSNALSMSKQVLMSSQIYWNS